MHSRRTTLPLQPSTRRSLVDACDIFEERLKAKLCEIESDFDFVKIFLDELDALWRDRRESNPPVEFMEDKSLYSLVYHLLSGYRYAPPDYERSANPLKRYVYYRMVRNIYWRRPYEVQETPCDSFFDSNPHVAHVKFKLFLTRNKIRVCALVRSWVEDIDRVIPFLEELEVRIRALLRKDREAFRNAPGDQPPYSLLKAKDLHMFLDMVVHSLQMRLDRLIATNKIFQVAKLLLNYMVLTHGALFTLMRRTSSQTIPVHCLVQFLTQDPVIQYLHAHLIGEMKSLALNMILDFVTLTGDVEAANKLYLLNPTEFPLREPLIYYEGINRNYILDNLPMLDHPSLYHDLVMESMVLSGKIMHIDSVIDTFFPTTNRRDVKRVVAAGLFRSYILLLPPDFLDIFREPWTLTGHRRYTSAYYLITTSYDYPGPNLHKAYFEDRALKSLITVSRLNRKTGMDRSDSRRKRSLRYREFILFHPILRIIEGKHGRGSALFKETRAKVIHRLSQYTHILFVSEATAIDKLDTESPVANEDEGEYEAIAESFIYLYESGANEAPGSAVPRYLTTLACTLLDEGQTFFEKSWYCEMLNKVMERIPPISFTIASLAFANLSSPRLLARANCFEARELNMSKIIRTAHYPHFVLYLVENDFSFFPLIKDVFKYALQTNFIDYTTSIKWFTSLLELFQPMLLKAVDSAELCDSLKATLTSVIRKVNTLIFDFKDPLAQEFIEALRPLFRKNPDYLIKRVKNIRPVMPVRARFIFELVKVLEPEDRRGLLAYLAQHMTNEEFHSLKENLEFLPEILALTPEAMRPRFFIYNQVLFQTPETNEILQDHFDADPRLLHHLVYNHKLRFLSKFLNTANSPQSQDRNSDLCGIDQLPDYLLKYVAIHLARMDKSLWSLIRSLALVSKRLFSLVSSVICNGERTVDKLVNETSVKYLGSRYSLLKTIPLSLDTNHLRFLKPIAPLDRILRNCTNLWVSYPLQTSGSNVPLFSDQGPIEAPNLRKVVMKITASPFKNPLRDVKAPALQEITYASMRNFREMEYLYSNFSKSLQLVKFTLVSAIRRDVEKVQALLERMHSSGIKLEFTTHLGSEVTINAFSKYLTKLVLSGQVSVPKDCLPQLTVLRKLVIDGQFSQDFVCDLVMSSKSLQVLKLRYIYLANCISTFKTTILQSTSLKKISIKLMPDYDRKEIRELWSLLNRASPTLQTIAIKFGIHYHRLTFHFPTLDNFHIQPSSKQRTVLLKRNYK